MNVQAPTIRTAVALLALVTLLSGCASAPPLADPPALVAERCAGHEVRADVAVGLCVGLSAEEWRSTFGMEPAALGVVPVWIVVENRSTDRSLLLDPGRVAIQGLGPGVGGSDVAGSIDESAKRLGNAAFATALVPYIGLVTAPALAVAQARKREEMLELVYQAFVAELRLQTLSPGERGQGVVFLREPDVPEGGGAVRFELVLLDLGSGAEERFALSAPLRAEEAAP
jgi:hypothetical protein